MITHAPNDYICPFCDWLAGNETEYKQNNDIVWQDEHTMAFVSPKWWVNNPGHVIVIPKTHYENIYDIPEEVLAKTYNTVKKMAIAVRDTYDCDGISTRQHNEPAGDQDVWHLHAHVYPRYKGDELYHNHNNRRIVDPYERAPYVQRLKKYFANESI